VNVSILLKRLHRRFFKREFLHPYFLFYDSGILLSLIVGALCAERIGGSGTVFLLAMLTVISLYPVYLFLKSKLFQSQARNFMKDSFVLLPVFLLVHLALGQDLSRAIFVFLISFLIILSLARLGCSVSGCCFGKPVAWGIRYPEIVFENIPSKRPFRPGANPGKPVFPLQLMESIIAICLVICMILLASKGMSIGLVNLWVFNVYIGVRFFTEFARFDRPKSIVHGLSETQWLVLAIYLAQTITLFVGN
jgi:phosphatidylglycerol:prolipoprotein diacylglycerol transferase